MSTPRGQPSFGFSPVAISGVAARLPGANTEQEFWTLLDGGQCAVGALPAGRWRPERFYHPRRSEPGFSYSFAGGYIDDPFDFDPGVFGISPREAAEMDPQQRLLLEVVWSALDDAGIAAGSLAGRNVGVYVGASSLDYGNLQAGDPASIESHFMTGNTLSVLSNRISYVFDLRGPSFTVDTACSSSLVAFAEAHAAITSGRIDMAIVAGVNLLLAPGSFIGFSRASMLSPSGLCRPFSANGDGYVRAEGAVAVVLSRLSTARERHHPVRAVAVASGINSDGKTSGISLPSMEGQRTLLDRLYGTAGSAHGEDGFIDPNRLAFVEAHGTGTRVGDPAEATAIGIALGQRRRNPLPIGSVKSNIGHLEPASGLAGLYKAILALEHRQLPPTLHADEVNPAIDLAGLNLTLANTRLPLPKSGTWLAGISSFGFGGTNAHVVIRQPEAAEQRPSRHRASLGSSRRSSSLGPSSLGASSTATNRNGAADGETGARLLVLSAYARPALLETATAYAGLLVNGGDAELLAKAALWQRDLGSHRLALPIGEPNRMAEALRRFAETGTLDGGVAGMAPSSPPKVCFVYSGNGCQWAGMGRTVYRRNDVFRQKFDAIDRLFSRLAGWSLVEALLDDGLESRLKRTRVAQPLLFAVQSALTASLAAWGLKPDMVLGHSVGEVAAAQASGALDLEQAVHVIYHRSEHQEGVHGLGTMAVVNLPAAEAAALVDASGLAGLEVAAINSPTATTIAGSAESVRGLVPFARQRRVAMRLLDLAYPFHSALLAPLRTPLLESLGRMATCSGDIPFLSTVTGSALDGRRLDADYWWRNVREPVRFRRAIEAAAEIGAGLYIEIGPRPILTTNIGDTLRGGGFDGAVIPSLVDKEDPLVASDPISLVLGRAIVSGCTPDIEAVAGPRPDQRVRLPAYAWQKKSFRQAQTVEAVDIHGTTARHPLIGARLSEGGLEWRNLIDATVVPYLADHRIDGEIIMPGAAFAEMALAVAREIFPEGPIGLEDFDLLQWLPLREDAMSELSIRLNGESRVVEIWSRPRLGGDDWSLCARGRIVRIASPAAPFIAPQDLPHHMNADQVYDSAFRAGVDYGPSFRRVLRAERTETLMEVTLSPVPPEAEVAGRPHILHPIALDAAFHAMFENIKPRADERYAYLPVRFASLRVDHDGGVPVRARVVVDRETDQSLSIAVTLYDAAGTQIAGLSGGLFRAVTLDRRTAAGILYHQRRVRLTRRDASARATAAAALAAQPTAERSDSWLLLEAFARALAHQSLHALYGDRPVTPLPDVSGTAQRLSLCLLRHLADAGLAVESDDGWRLAADSGLPTPDAILETFAAEASGATAELVLAAQALTGLAPWLAGGRPTEIRPAVREQLESDGLLLGPLLAAVLAMCTALQTACAPDPLRVLIAEPGCLGLLRCLTPLVLQGRATITVIGTDAKRLQRTAARRGPVDGVTFEVIENQPHETGVEGTSDASLEGAYDVALAFADGRLFGGDTALGRAIARRLPSDGLLLTVRPPDSPIFDVLLGTADDWFADSAMAHTPAGWVNVGRIGLAQDSARLLVASGFGAIDGHSLADGRGDILFATPDARNSAAPRGMPLILLDTMTRSAPFVEAIVQALRADGRAVRLIATGSTADEIPAWTAVSAALADEEGAELIFPAFSIPGEMATGGLATVMIQLAALLRALQTEAHACRLWVLVSGLDSMSAEAMDPLAEAVACFVRVAINEYPSIDLRLVDIGAALPTADAAQQFVRLIGAPPEETEVLIDAAGTAALRTLPGLGRASGTVPAAAVRLDMRSKGVMGSVDWIETARVAPGPSEVEVAVEAAGLNFRDIMLATGLLDDDVLDDGLAGAVFGFECAGRVVAVGSEVSTLRPGDAVMGFGRQSFASHVTADAQVFSPVPDGMAVEAAATIPVAFLTAWYALVHMARLQPGEWVLIHGAAGGVGLAAMQIARLRGARIAATVGTPDKRALVTLFGAERIYSSRSTAFHDALRAEIGGVDVVLNSLAGDAMLASVKCLKPFGRFIELGKRDYVLNTPLGLRPFRRNLTYFGVDLDQLLAANLPLAQRLMADMAPHFASGALSPLPHRSFDGHAAGEAFQLMQAAGHVGKLLIRPPTPPIPTRSPRGSFVAGPGVHLVVGGTGGFGFETACWLAEKGARSIVVASRRGRLEASAAARVESLRSAGVTFSVETLDVTDSAAVTALIERLRRTHGRLAGVLHTAMVLDDGIIDGLQTARVEAVLAPKVDGALHLDRATRGDALDYFVVYSSVTTMIGNPGQAAYVAANGFLQGLMRRRRAEGLPGLAVAWGAIKDAGVLARDADTADKLERLSGIVAMPANTALDQLDGLLARPWLCPATVYCASFRPAGKQGGGVHGLKLLATPAFRHLFATSEDGAPDTVVDLAGLVAGKTEVEARILVAGLVAGEVARILRLATEEIDPGRPLDELGMDSLMSLELRLAIENRFGVELPVVAISAASNINDLATRLIGGGKTGAADGAGSGNPMADTPGVRGTEADNPKSADRTGTGDLERQLIRQHASADLELSDLLAVTESLGERRAAVTALL